MKRERIGKNDRHLRPLGDELLCLDRRVQSSTAVLVFVLGWLAYSVSSRMVAGAEAGLVLPIACASGVLIWKIRVLKLQRHFERRAVECEDTGEVGPLLKPWNECSSAVSKIAGKALLHLLPKLSRDDQGNLRRCDHERMHSILRSSRQGYNFDPFMVEALLNAQTKVGIPSSVEVVEELANSADHQFTRERALAVLPAVRECAERSHNAEILLRVAEVPVDAEALLRPAGTGVVDEEQLLRPSGLGG